MLDFSNPRNQICAFLVVIGAFFVIMTYGAMIASRRSGKFVSGVPFFGALFILAGFLISTNRWLAFTALVDPGVWMLLAGILRRK